VKLGMGLGFGVEVWRDRYSRIGVEEGRRGEKV
jgi:hypothetical protein